MYYALTDPLRDESLWAGANRGDVIQVNPVAPESQQIVRLAVRTGLDAGADAATAMAYEACVAAGFSPYVAGFDLGEVLTHPADDLAAIGNAASDLADQIGALPGVSDVAGAIKSFAQSTVGQIVFTAIASALTTGLAPILGAQASSIAFALPGVVQGQPLDHAYWDGLGQRISMTAEVAGPQVAQAAAQQLKPVTDALTANGSQLLHLLDQGKETLASLEQKTGFRQDMIQSGVDLLERTNTFGSLGSVSPAVLVPLVGSVGANAAAKVFGNKVTPPTPGKLFDPKTGKQIMNAPLPAPPPAPGPTLAMSASAINVLQKFQNDAIHLAAVRHDGSTYTSIMTQYEAKARASMAPPGLAPPVASALAAAIPIATLAPLADSMILEEIQQRTLAALPVVHVNLPNAAQVTADINEDAQLSGAPPQAVWSKFQNAARVSLSPMNPAAAASSAVDALAYKMLSAELATLRLRKTSTTAIVSAAAQGHPDAVAHVQATQAAASQGDPAALAHAGELDAAFRGLTRDQWTAYYNRMHAQATSQPAAPAHVSGGGGFTPVYAAGYCTAGCGCR